MSFKGCLLIVSHDRYFLDKIVDHLFIIREGGLVKDFVGQYSEYREYIKEQETEEARQAKILAEKAQRQKATENDATNTPTSTPTRKKLSYKEQRELEALEKEIPQLELQKSELEEKLSSGALSHEELNNASERIGELLALIEEKEMRWLELSEV